MKYGLRLLTVLYGDMELGDRAGDWNQKLTELPGMEIGVVGEYVRILVEGEYELEGCEDN